jgi:translation elongation factor EF-Tu-like GTPase
VSKKKKDNPLDRYGRNAGLELVYTSNKGDVHRGMVCIKAGSMVLKTMITFMYVGGQYSGRKLTAMINLRIHGSQIIMQTWDLSNA